MTNRSAAPSRRTFLKTAALATGAAALPSWAAPAHARRDTGLRIGVIGCGGRGTGAAANALEASPDARIVALGDVFPEHLSGCRSQLASLGDGFGGRGAVAEDACFLGFDAYRRVLAAGVDLVILATPPHFRPIHLAAAVDAGKHVFAEKPVAVDPAGVRAVIASGEAAKSKGLSIVAGTQRRHERSYTEAMQRVHDGAIGRVVAARCSWNQGGLWMHERAPEWTDMEWQLRNWLYFTWLSGDHIVEQHVHNLDVVNWALGAAPVRCGSLGGRQCRTSPAYGCVFDHFATEFEYPGGVLVSSQCRQIDGCSGRVDETIYGTDGVCTTSPGAARIEGKAPWLYEAAGPHNPYVQEHADLHAAIRLGTAVNGAAAVAASTLTAVMGRMSAYTGKAVTWEQASESALDLSPPAYEFGPLPVAEVAVPGRTPLL
ncbi:MAG: Gfo/Idh/MocA family oxidoreductase [Phycisphaerales bacterium]|nr:Gfo/Idh/MocA family oxidoreductase [Phycisphaerales bacterium]